MTERDARPDGEERPRTTRPESTTRGRRRTPSRSAAAASRSPSRDLCRAEQAAEHAAGEFAVPEGYGVLEGAPNGARRSVGIVVSRFNGAVTGKLLEGALAELDAAGVAREAITVMPVPGAFELPLAAMALAKTRRYACIVALGCVIRGDTPHFDFVAGEAASGLQLAALETGVPVSFGVLTLEQAGPGGRPAGEGRRGGPHRPRDGRRLRPASRRCGALSSVASTCY